MANNCPCHINCYRGCENCGTWDCPNREWVDPDTPIWAQPDGIGNENNIDGTFYELVFSDEFNGNLLNSNKWHLRDEQGKQRSHWLNEDGSETVKIQTLYEPKHNYLDGKGNLVQRWTKNSNDPPLKDDEFKGSHFSSGRIDTHSIFAPVYGWFEARLNTVPTNGIMTAWWMWPENGLWDYNNDECPEPNNAWWGSEIDILEARKYDDFASVNIHYGGYK